MSDLYRNAAFNLAGELGDTIVTVYSCYCDSVCGCAAAPADPHAAMVARIRKLADDFEWYCDMQGYATPSLWSHDMRAEADRLEANP